MTRTAKILLGALVLLTLVCLFGVTLYPARSLLPTGASLAPPDARHWLGTDDLGTDIFAQLAAGFFSSMSIGLAAAALSFALGGAAGIVAGWRGGVWDTALSLCINLFLSLPQLPLMIVIGAFFGQSRANLVAVVTLFSWAPIAKVLRARTRALQGRGYVRMAKCYGAKTFYLVRRHMAAELLPLLAVQALGVIGKAILQEASLAYLGLSDPLAKSWGLMIRKCTAFRGIYYTNYWLWWLVPPVVLLAGTVLCVRLLAREAESALRRDLQ